MAAIGGEDLLGGGLPGCFACYAISDFTGGFAGFFICGLALDNESLSDVREVEIVVEFGCGPYFSDFNPAVIRGIILDEIGIVSIFKIKCDILKKSGLVVLDGKVVMSMAIPNQIVSDIALGEQGICGNFFALNIDSIKEGDGGLDFVGTFMFLTALYREGADFFWV